MFFVCHEKTQKSSGAVLCFPAKGYAAAPKTVRTCAKRRTYFLFFLRIDVAAGGGGTIDKTDRRGSVWM